MNKKLKLLLAMLTVTTALGVAAACDNSSSTTSSSSSSSSSAPATKEKYEVKFVDDDNTLLSNEKVEEGVIPEAPANPTKAEDTWYTYAFKGWDKELTAVEDDVIYKATYTATKKTHTVVFKVDGEEVASKTYDVDTAKDSITPDVSAYDTVADQDVAWEEFELDGVANKVVNAVRTDTLYTVTFVDEEGEQVLAPMTYTVQGKDSFVFPEIPEELKVPGYTMEWDKTKADLVSGGLEVTLKATPRPYTITLDSKGMPLTNNVINVNYNETYEIPSPTVQYCTFLGWYDEDGNKWEATSGTWTIQDDIELTARYNKNITFDDIEAVPGCFKVADQTESLSIVNGGVNGSKMLQIHANGGAPAMNATVAFLAEYFADSDVDYIAFDAKATKNNNNFRRDTRHSSGALNAVTYEHDMTFTNPVDSVTYPTTGVRADAWKTFYFSRADYDFWVSQNKTEARFIATGGFASGDNIYIDNIRPATSAERAVSGYSFESVGIRVNDAGGVTLLFYMLDKGTTWQFNMGSAGFTNVGITSENATDGNSALKFTKAAGELSINMPSNKSPYTDIVTKTGYWAIDIYVPEDADTTFIYQTTNYPGVTPKKGAWSTYYLSNNMNVVKLTDTTGGTYLIDNIRSITAEEYKAGAYSFEANASGLRHNETDGTTYYWYAGADHSANRYSIAFTGNSTGVSFNNEQVKDGKYSVKVEKASDGAQVNLQMRADSDFWASMKNGFTFWIYSDKAIDASNFCNAFDKPFLESSINANEWTQITVTKEDLRDLSGEASQALRLKGDWTTIYLDGFAPLPADAE